MISKILTVFLFLFSTVSFSAQASACDACKTDMDTPVEKQIILEKPRAPVAKSISYVDIASKRLKMDKSAFVDLGAVELNKPHLVTLDKQRNAVILVGSNGNVIAGTYIDKDGHIINEMMIAAERRKVIKTLTPENSLTIGHGKAHIIVFTDPDCPACQSFETMLKINDLEKELTITYVYFPLNIHPHAKEDTQKIWCAGEPSMRRDRMVSIMLKKQPVNGKINPGCSYPTENARLKGLAIGLRGTPTILTPTGKSLPFTGNPAQFMKSVRTNQ